MSKEPHILLKDIEQAMRQPSAIDRNFRPINPTVRYPVPGMNQSPGAEGQAGERATRALMAASFAMGGVALAVAFNSPSVLFATAAGIAIMAAGPWLRKYLPQRRKKNALASLSWNAAASENAIDRSFELGETSGQIATIFDALGDMVVATGLNGRIVYANETFRTVTGGKEPAGLTLKEAGINPQPAGKNGSREVRFGAGDDETIWLWHEAPARDPESGDIRIHCVGRNVTAERHANAELTDAREKAEAANRAKSRFLATVSHEIRTPLNGILGMTHLLEQTPVTPEQGSYLKTVRESGQSLLSLIEDLLDATSIEAGKLHLRREEGTLAELVESVTELMASRAHGKGIEIAAHVSADAPQRIITDLGRLRQVLFNLVGNAVKFTDKGGIMVEASAEDGQLVFRVTDSGPGLKPEDKTRIFQEFERADNSVTARHGGAGLGLSISARIIAALGGTISVESEPGKGASFRFTASYEEVEGLEKPDRFDPPLAGRAALVIAPQGPVSASLVWTIRDLGGHAESACDEKSLIAALARLNRDGGRLTDILVDKRLSALADSLSEASPHALGDGLARTLVIAPEDSRDASETGRKSGEAWLVRPVRASSLVTVLTRRDDRQERDRLANRREAQPIPRPSGSETLDILLAEDNPVNALVVRTMLAKAGHRVTVVENGRELLKQTMERSNGRTAFDLVITDLSMPDMDGKTAIETIRAREFTFGYERVPIIVLTADGQASTRDELLAAGANAFAEKPVDPAGLLQLAALHGKKVQATA